MEETYMLDYPGVKKKILSGGRGPMPHCPPGTKLVFHFQTLKDDFERTVIDDSRLAKRPMEIFVGKMFKVEVWEVLLSSMRIGEVAEFWCDAVHTGLYPIASKGMRLIAQGKDPLEGQKHMCGMGNMYNYHSTGYPELDELMRVPQPLIFILELIEVGDLMSYKRESWMMKKDEKLNSVPPLHKEGNTLVKQRRFREAAACYQEAVVTLRAAQSREKPGDEDYISLARLIIPLVLNYCQCMLELEEYYEVIEHTTELLEKHKDCTKAYYKRAKAHAAVWNEKEARKDFHMVGALDITLSRLVWHEIEKLSERMKEKYKEEKEQYWNKLKEEKRETEKKDVEDEEGKEEDEGEDDEVSLTGMVKTKGIESKKASVQEETEAKEVKEEAATNEKPVGANINTPLELQGKDWQQMLQRTMHLQKEGNLYMTDRRHDVAAKKFREALEYVNDLQTKRVEYKGEDWESLEKVRVPLTLNLSQCCLELREYEQVVELTDHLLKRHKGSMRALYQRARAHAALYHEEEAKEDLARIQRRYPKFKPVVQHELRKLGQNIRDKSSKDKKNYWSTLEDKYGSTDKAQVAKKAAKKAAKKKKVVKWTDQAAKEEAAAEESKEGQMEGSDEKKEGSEAVAGEALAGSDHTSTKQVKAPAVAGAGEDKADKTPRSGGDKTSEGAPLTAAASAASEISKGIKEANEIKAQSEIKGDSTNENPPDAAGSTVQTASANKEALASDAGAGGCGAEGGVETERLAEQSDGAGEKEKDGTGAKPDVKKKTIPDPKGAPKGPRAATSTGKTNKPPTHTPKQKNKNKKKK